MNRGMLYAAGAYLVWGFLPIYWKSLQVAGAVEILSHRIAWSFVLLVGVLLYQNHWRWLGLARSDRRTMLTFLASSTLLTINWLVYIWAVNAGYLVESSLGYFMNPLVNVLLGVFFLGERLRFGQWLAIGLAASGVLYLTIIYGSLPWIGLSLALSFGLYGLLRKTARLNSLEGLTLETALLVLPFAGYLFYLQAIGVGAFGRVNLQTTLLLAFTGVITAAPLLLFAAGARRIPLSTLGLIQYVAPSIQFLLGIFLYGEPFSATRLIGFCIVWLALAVYSLENVIERRRVSPPLRVNRAPKVA